MTEQDWHQIKHFSPAENWGDPSRMEVAFIQRLDAFRSCIESPVIITCGTQGRHRENSLHGYGLAVDCVIPGRPLLDNWIDACRFDFTGLGFYPDWEYKGKQTGGLHLEWDSGEDVRRFWMGIGKHHWDTQYVGMNRTNLQMFYLKQ